MAAALAGGVGAVRLGGGCSAWAVRSPGVERPQRRTYSGSSGKSSGPAEPAPGKPPPPGRRLLEPGGWARWVRRAARGEFAPGRPRPLRRRRPSAAPFLLQAPAAARRLPPLRAPGPERCAPARRQSASAPGPAPPPLAVGPGGQTPARWGLGRRPCRVDLRAWAVVCAPLGARVLTSARGPPHRALPEPQGPRATPQRHLLPVPGEGRPSRAKDCPFPGSARPIVPSFRGSAG